MLKQVRHKESGDVYDLGQEYLEYYSEEWNGWGSGPYVMRTPIYLLLLVGLGLGTIVGGGVGSLVHAWQRHHLQLWWKKVCCAWLTCRWVYATEGGEGGLMADPGCPTPGPNGSGAAAASC